jgi:hypothetical protein
VNDKHYSVPICRVSCISNTAWNNATRRKIIERKPRSWPLRRTWLHCEKKVSDIPVPSGNVANLFYSVLPPPPQPLRQVAEPVYVHCVTSLSLSLSFFSRYTRMDVCPFYCCRPKKMGEGKGVEPTLRRGREPIFFSFNFHSPLEMRAHSFSLLFLAPRCLPRNGWRGGPSASRTLSSTPWEFRSGTASREN